MDAKAIQAYKTKADRVRTIPEIHSIMLDCLDFDNMEASRIRIQHILTPEEVKSMQDFNAEYEKKQHAINSSHSLEMITDEERDKAIEDLREEKFNTLNGEDDDSINT